MFKTPEAEDEDGDLACDILGYRYIVIGGFVRQHPIIY